MCLLHDLEEILTPSTILNMEDELVERLAAESPAVKAKRAELSDKEDKLSSAYIKCARHARGNLGNSIFWPGSIS